jgi:uncharacterized MAPEG superfamily protein
MGSKSTMGYELNYLIWISGIAAIMWVPYILSRIQQQGLVQAMGYVENPPEPPKWAQRSQRAHLNLLESLPIFAALVLVAQLTNSFDTLTAAGAALFFWGRIAHALVFIAGIPYLRTLAFTVAWVGLVLIFYALVT